MGIALDYCSGSEADTGSRTYISELISPKLDADKHSNTNAAKKSVSAREDPLTKGYLAWNMARETARTSDGRSLTVVAVGYSGYTCTVYHPDEGVAHVTGHLDGTQHAHGYMSTDPERGDKVRSNERYRGGLDIIGKPNPKG